MRLNACSFKQLSLPFLLDITFLVFSWNVFHRCRCLTFLNRYDSSFGLYLGSFAFRSDFVPSRLFDEAPQPPAQIDDHRTVLQLDETDPTQGILLVCPPSGDYFYEKGAKVRPAIHFTEQLGVIKDYLTEDDAAAACELYQRLKHEAESMVRYGVEALEALSKTANVSYPVTEQFLYDVCPTLAQPFIDNVSRQ